ncbi:MAG TPA: carboxypeptidase regulatory-like domain-containing protein, partial [Rhodothermia bacterium]
MSKRRSDTRITRPPPAGRAAMSAILTLLTPLTAAAQAPGQTDPAQYSFIVTGAPLAEALDALATETSISLVYDAELVRGKRAFCDVRNSDVESLLGCVLAGTGLDFHRLSSGTYVVREALRVDSRGAIAGRIVDANTGRPISGANILLPEERSGAATNGAGRFVIGSLNPGPYAIVVSHVAYHDAADSVFVTPFGRSEVSVSLAPRTRVVAPIVINGFRERLPASAQVHRFAADSDLSTLTGAGSADMLSNLDAVSGIRFGDALSDVHVQGGAAGEHQYRLDGATLFVPLRNGGFVGPFSPFAVRQITVQKAGYGAPYGSHLSGVVEIDQEAAPGDRSHVLIQADEMAVNGRISGSVGHDQALRATWMVAGRKDIWDLHQPAYVEDVIDDWSRPDTFLTTKLGFASSDVPPQSPHTVGFSDVHAFVGLDVGVSRSISLSHYTGTNRFGNEFEGDGGQSELVQDAYRWRNAITSVGGESILSASVLAQIVGWSSFYEMQHPFDRSPPKQSTSGECSASCASPEADDFNDVEEVGIRTRLDVVASHDHSLTVGAEVIRTAGEMSISIDPYAVRSASGSDHFEIGIWRFTGFVEDGWTIGGSTEVRAGTRLTWLDGIERVFAEPRVSLRSDRSLSGGRSWAAEAAAGLYRQFLHQFDGATYGETSLLPSIRFWRPVTGDEEPPKAVHIAGSFLLHPGDNWRVVLETFFKSLPRIREINYVGPSEKGAGGEPPDLLVDAEGRSYGLGAAVERSTDRISVGIYYDYESTRRRI